MDEIVWTSRLSTGVEILDAQHRDLIDKLRALEEAIRAGQTISVLMDSFRFLGLYMHDHFRDEEAEMARLQCPESELNHRGHARFLETFEVLTGRLLAKGPSEQLALDVHHELSKWFLDHILLVDVCMAKAVAQQR
jgi:hemerythrin